MIVIYTSLMGEKEKIENPIEFIQNFNTDLKVAFVCFTDKKNLKSDIWQFVEIDNYCLSSEKSSRLPKILPHKYLSSFEYSLYIDNTIKLKRLPNSLDLLSDRPYLYKLFKHSGRNNLYDEALAIVNLGYERVDIIAQQLLHYSNYIDPRMISPLSTCPVILRSHNSSQIKNFSEKWWYQFLAFSKRDQMSFDFCRIISNLEIEYFPGDPNNSDLIAMHQTLNPNRIFANFDHQKYKILKKLELNDMNVEKHYLDSSPGLIEAINFSKKNSIIEYFSILEKSGLSNSIYPNRNLSFQIEEKLSSYKNSKKLLILFNNFEFNQENINQKNIWYKNEIKSFSKVVEKYLEIEKIENISIDEESKNFLFSNNNNFQRAEIVFLFNIIESSLNEIFEINFNKNITLDRGLIFIFNFIYPKSKSLLNIIKWIEKRLEIKIKNFQLDEEFLEKGEFIYCKYFLFEW